MSSIALYFVYPFGMGLLAFTVQQGICRSERNLLLRMLPGIAVLVGLIGCATPFIVDPYSEDLLTVAALFLAGLGLAGMLLGCIAAWVHYAAVRFVQNRRK